MPIDASIYSQLDTQAPARLSQLISQGLDPVARQERMLRLSSLVGQNNLQQYQLSSAQRQDDLQNQLLSDLRASGGDQSKIQQAYTNAGQADKAIQFQKSNADLKDANLKIATSKTEMYRNQLANVNDPNSAAQWLLAQHNDPDMASTPIGSSDPSQTIAKIPTDPQGFAQWKQQAGMGMTKYLEKFTPSADAQLSASTARRGQDLTDLRQREMNGILAGKPSASGVTPVNPIVQKLVDAVGGYETPQNIALSNKVPFAIRADVLDQLNKQYPDYSPQKFAENNKTVMDYSGSGKGAQEVKAQSTAVSHIAALRQLSDAQAQADKTGDWQLFNRVANSVASHFGGVAPSNLQAAVAMVAPEISKAVVGTQSAEADRAKFADALNSQAKSPDQFSGVLDTQTNLLSKRLLENERVYARSGRKDFRTDKFLNPETLQAMTKVEQGGAQSPQPNSSPPQPQSANSVTTPDGKMINFPSAAAAQAFKLKFGLK